MVASIFRELNEEIILQESELVRKIYFREVRKGLKTSLKKILICPRKLETQELI